MVIKELNKFLADLTVLSKKVQNFHWNIEGKGFFTVHTKLDEIYDELNENVDVIAERILALGDRPLSNYASYLEITEIQEGENRAITIDEALNALMVDFKFLVGEAKKIKIIADEESDFGTSSIIDEFIVSNEKLLWMLRVCK